MSIRKTKKKTRETTSIGSLAGQFSKNFASGKFVVICILHALSVSHEKTCLIGTCHSQVSQTTVEVGKCWEKRGTNKVWDNQDTSKMNGYITSHPHHPKGLELLQRHNRRLHAAAVRRNADTSRRCHPGRIVQLPLPWRALKLKSSSGLHKGMQRTFIEAEMPTAPHKN